MSAGQKSGWKTMVMRNNEGLQLVVDRLVDNDLAGALSQLRCYASTHPELDVLSPLSNIESSYHLMVEYWKQGIKDEHLDNVYSTLKMRTYRLAADTWLKHAVSRGGYFALAYRKVLSSGREWSTEEIKGELEEFVSDIAMLDFDPEHVRKPKRTELFARHQQYMNNLFDYIRTSSQWTDGMADVFTEILLSPTVESIDRQLIVSAIMLGAMSAFDVNKWKVLAEVYRQSTDEQLRQRALVGWVFSLGDKHYSIFPEQKSMLESLLSDDKVCEELTQLQMQIVYCANAESDNRTIQDEIMPDIIKHNSLRITKDGIEEKDDDPMQDILDPEASERGMEALEQKFKKMIDMQKAGSDIYFGGFSQMKRFPFFDSISNWFVPYYTDHPALSGLYAKESDFNMVSAIVNNGSFCDSDKYSFAIAFRQVVDRLPANIREMMASGNASMGLNGMSFVNSKENKDAPAYIRRLYLQNIYRFYKLHPSRGNISNPFGEIFFVNEVLHDTPLTRKCTEVAAFFIKRRQRNDAIRVLDLCAESSLRDFNYLMLRGYIHSDAQWYKLALNIRPDDRKALKNYAKTLFNSGSYAKALPVYDRIIADDEGNTSALFSHAVCLVNLNRTEEGIKELYRLDYEHPDNATIISSLALAHFKQGKYPQAISLYAKISSILGEVTVDDSIYLGLCEWFAGSVPSAISAFSRYVKGMYKNEYTDIQITRFRKDLMRQAETEILSRGITPAEIQLMACSAIYG